MPHNGKYKVSTLTTNFQISTDHHSVLTLYIVVRLLNFFRMKTFNEFLNWMVIFTLIIFLLVGVTRAGWPEYEFEWKIIGLFILMTWRLTYIIVRKI